MFKTRNFGLLIVLIFNCNFGFAGSMTAMSIKGNVTTILNGGKEVKVTKGKVLKEGAIVMAHKNATGVFLLDDETTVKLDQDSTVTVESLITLKDKRYFGKSIIKVVRGSLAVRMTNQIGGDYAIQIKNSKNKLISSNGADFFVGVDRSSQDTWASVKDGKIDVLDPDDDDFETAKEDESIVLISGKKLTKPHEFKWIKGLNWNMDPKSGIMKSGFLDLASMRDDELGTHIDKITSRKKKPYLKLGKVAQEAADLNNEHIDLSKSDEKEEEADSDSKDSKLRNRMAKNRKLLRYRSDVNQAAAAANAANGADPSAQANQVTTANPNATKGAAAPAQYTNSAQSASTNNYLPTNQQTTATAVGVDAQEFADDGGRAAVARGQGVQLESNQRNSRGSVKIESQSNETASTPGILRIKKGGKMFKGSSKTSTSSTSRTRTSRTNNSEAQRERMRQRHNSRVENSRAPASTSSGYRPSYNGGNISNPMLNPIVPNTPTLPPIPTNTGGQQEGSPADLPKLPEQHKGAFGL